MRWAGDAWIETGLIFTGRHGTPIEPRNFNRSFDRCIVAARVPRITVHGTRTVTLRGIGRLSRVQQLGVAPDVELPTLTAPASPAG